jgi:hypothetical protein
MTTVNPGAPPSLRHKGSRFFRRIKAVTKNTKNADEIAVDEVEQEPTNITQDAIGSDPFDPASLRLNDAVNDGVGVKRLLTTVPVRKPSRQEFVRVHPDPDYRLTPAGIIEFENDVYLVHPSVAEELADEFVLTTLYLTITRQGVVLFWPAKLPTTDRRALPWRRSEIEAAERAFKYWTRIRANMQLGADEIDHAVGNLGEPTWPDLPMKDLLKIAFRDCTIDDLSHTVIRQLHGEI